jgi:hypothetical protein
MASPRRRRALLSAALAVAFISAGTILPASPAMAYSADCNPIGGNWCQTGIVSASASHKIRMIAYWRKTVCRLYDADNGIQVATLYVPQGSFAGSKDVTGLYNRYFMTCGSTVGLADGLIHNDL